MIEPAVTTVPLRRFGHVAPHARSPMRTRVLSRVRRLHGTHARAQVPLRLPASPEGAPYCLVPYMATPGAESPFKLSVLVDDLDDDGKPDIVLEPVLPNPPNPSDWYVTTKRGQWARSAAAPNAPGFGSNDRLAFSIASGGGGAAEGRVVICVETRGVNSDMRLVEGMQQGASCDGSTGFIIGVQEIFARANATLQAAGGVAVQHEDERGSARAIADDLALVGPPDLVYAVYEDVLTELAEIGLELVPKKCKVYSPSGVVGTVCEAS